MNAVDHLPGVVRRALRPHGGVGGLPQLGFLRLRRGPLAMFIFGERRGLRREAGLPVGHDLTADFGDVSRPCPRRPGYVRELPYAYFRGSERDGALVRLEDGTDRTWWPPAAVITPEGELWFRHHAVTRDLASEPLPPGIRAQPGRRARHHLAVARLFDATSAKCGPPVTFGVLSLPGAWLVAPMPAPCSAGSPMLGFRCSARQCTAAAIAWCSTTPSDRCRIGATGELVVDSVNFRERIDPAAITMLERRQGLGVRAPHDLGGERSRGVPEPLAAPECCRSAAATSPRFKQRLHSLNPQVSAAKGTPHPGVCQAASAP